MIPSHRYSFNIAQDEHQVSVHDRREEDLEEEEEEVGSPVTVNFVKNRSLSPISFELVILFVFLLILMFWFLDWGLGVFAIIDFFIGG